MKVVSVYNENGWQRDLPSLLLGRANHGCTSFVSGNKRVNRNLIFVKNRSFIRQPFQLLLVSGGGSSHVARDIDTTEIYDGISWKNAGKLPLAMGYFPIINIGNKILSFGKNAFGRNLLKD